MAVTQAVMRMRWAACVRGAVRMRMMGRIVQKTAKVSEKQLNNRGRERERVW